MENQKRFGILTTDQLARIISAMDQLQAVTRMVTGSAAHMTVPFADVYAALEKFKPVEKEDKTDG